MAFLLFSFTAVSLPLLLEKEIDFVSAMIQSMRCVRQVLAVMFIWALIAAVMMLVALLPFFLRLFVALPALGHATRHQYRRALYLSVSSVQMSIDT